MKLSEKGGLEGRSPSKYHSFWQVAATFVAATCQKGSARGITPRAPLFKQALGVLHSVAKPRSATQSLRDQANSVL